MVNLARCFNARDFERAAKKRLPRPLFDYIAGGSDDERTVRANSDAFSRYSLVPRTVQGTGKPDMRRTVLGREMEWPLILAPTGMTRLFDPGGELAVAAEAARSGAGYSLSTMATTSIEDVAAIGSGARIYQLYMLADEGLNFASIDRCRAAGYDAICLTVDTIAAGNRERDLRSGLTVPPRLNLRSIADFAMRPGWCARYFSGGRFSLPNVTANGSGDVSTLAAFFAANMDANITWKKVERLAAHWGGPFAIKGIQAAEDAIAARDAGASAIVVSNHGGRQLDGACATIDLVADLVDTLGHGAEVILDGGIRRGTDIVKALAMGASACMTGRPYLYALAAGGQAGVARMLALLRAETERAMTLTGCGSLAELGRDHLRLSDAVPAFLAARHAN